MLAATMFSLLLPGLDAGAVAYGMSGSAALIVTSLALGGLTLWVAHRPGFERGATAALSTGFSTMFFCRLF